MLRLGLTLLLFFMIFTLLANSVNASYMVTYLNVTVTLNKNTSAQVTELMRVVITNTSINQYSQNRVALNLTLSDWQQLIGPLLVQHIINPTTSVYNFKFLPGPMSVNIFGNNYAYMLMTYNVKNVSFVNQTAPRTFNYSFNPSVFNFAHALSGQTLPQNTTLTIILPSGSVVRPPISPPPDFPAGGFTNNYANITRFTWAYGEPLSKFTLRWTLTQSVQAEVTAFFISVYNYLGVFTYVIIGIVILFFIIYTYLKVSFKK